MSETALAPKLETETITAKIPAELAAWVRDYASVGVLSVDEIVWYSLAASRAKVVKNGETNPKQPPRFMRLAGIVKGLPSDLSKRKGFDRG